jgi:hypothetical protein
VTQIDLSKVPEEKLNYILQNGDPNGQLYPLAKRELESRRSGARSRNLSRVAEESQLGEAAYSEAASPYSSAARRTAIGASESDPEMQAAAADVAAG